GNVDTSQVGGSGGDAIDFTASGGTGGNPAVLMVNLSGAITGAVKGIVVTQKGQGDVTVQTSGNVVGLAGSGITATIQTASGGGNITVGGCNGTGDVTGTGAGSIGIDAEIQNG